MIKMQLLLNLKSLLVVVDREKTLISLIDRLKKEMHRQSVWPHMSKKPKVKSLATIAWDLQEKISARTLTHL
jgi:hypothetical protein